MSEGGKFIEKDQAIIQIREQAKKELENPYFMAQDEKDQNETQVSAQIDDQDVKKTEQEKDQELDLTNFVQLSDDLWGATVQMNVMTDATIDINDPTKPVMPSAAELAKAAAEKQAKQVEEENKAVIDARNELLKPDIVDQEAIQTSDIETQKLQGVLSKIQSEDHPEDDKKSDESDD